MSTNPCRKRQASQKKVIFQIIYVLLIGVTRVTGVTYMFLNGKICYLKNLSGGNGGYKSPFFVIALPHVTQPNTARGNRKI